MSDKTREHISSLMDGEISRESSRFLVRRLGSDEELCATWARYHVVRDCLRHQEGSFSTEDLCGRVNLALQDEAPASASRRLPTAWLKPFAGAAIAASVALMAVVMVGPGQDFNATAPIGTEQAAVESFTSPQGLSSRTDSRQVSLNGRAASNQRMNAYLLRHYQAAGAAHGAGFVALVPVVVQRGAEDGEADTPDDSEDQAKSSAQ